MERVEKMDVLTEFKEFKSIKSKIFWNIIIIQMYIHMERYGTWNHMDIKGINKGDGNFGFDQNHIVIILINFN